MQRRAYGEKENSPEVITFTVNVSLAAEKRGLAVEGILANAALQAGLMPFLIDGGQVEAILHTRERRKNATRRRK